MCICVQAVRVHSGRVLLRPKNKLGNLAEILKFDHHFMNASKVGILAISQFIWFALNK